MPVVRNALTGTLTFAQLLAQLRQCSGKQAVFRVLPGRFLMIPDGSPRLVAIELSSDWSSFLVGYFYPDVPRDVLLSEVM